VNIDPGLAAAVASQLGIAVPPPLPPSTNLPIPDYPPSPPLSLLARPGKTGIRTRRIALLVASGIGGDTVRELYAALLKEGAQPRLVGQRAIADLANGFACVAVGLADRASPLTRIDADRFAVNLGVRFICQPKSPGNPQRRFVGCGDDGADPGFAPDLERMVQGRRRCFAGVSPAPAGTIGVPAQLHHGAVLAKEGADIPDEFTGLLFLHGPPSGAMDQPESRLRTEDAPGRLAVVRSQVGGGDRIGQVRREGIEVLAPVCAKQEPLGAKDWDGSDELAVHALDSLVRRTGSVVSGRAMGFSVPGCCRRRN